MRARRGARDAPGRLNSPVVPMDRVSVGTGSQGERICSSGRDSPVSAFQSGCRFPIRGLQQRRVVPRRCVSFVPGWAKDFLLRDLDTDGTDETDHTDQNFYHEFREWYE